MPWTSEKYQSVQEKCVFANPFYLLFTANSASFIFGNKWDGTQRLTNFHVRSMSIDLSLSSTCYSILITIDHLYEFIDCQSINSILIFDDDIFWPQPKPHNFNFNSPRILFSWTFDGLNLLLTNGLQLDVATLWEISLRVFKTVAVFPFIFWLFAIQLKTRARREEIASRKQKSQFACMIVNFR